MFRNSILRLRANIIPPSSMLTNSNSIPRLPIPTLEDTAKSYLRSVKPLTTEEEFQKEVRMCSVECAV